MKFFDVLLSVGLQVKPGHPTLPEHGIGSNMGNQEDTLFKDRHVTHEDLRWSNAVSLCVR